MRKTCPSSDHKTKVSILLDQVILGLPYGPSIDVWSLGCILAELYTGYPLFPGENEADQLSCIMEVLGNPPNSVIEAASRRRLFFGKNL